ncbi:MAG: acetolactate synthase large subunit [Pseudomonadota bacterium]
MRASDLLLRCLEAQGVDTIFGVPGEENADIMISLLNSSINFITTRHEQSAAFMADMYGRLTGKPGVCMSTLGPGATNLITGVANANMDNVPLIAIVGQASTKRLHKESHQNMDSVDMYKPVTKWATTVRDPHVIPEIIHKAFKLAMMAKPGAVMIELPEDIAHEEAQGEPIRQASVDFQTGVDLAHVGYALELIEKSEAPLLLVGNGAVHEACDHPLEKFVDATNIYTAVTFMGKGALSARHSKSLYCVGLGMKDIALKAFDQADLVICVGYSMVEWHPNLWNNGRAKKIIHIDVLPAEVDAKYVPEIELVGEITGILRQMNSKLTSAHQKDAELFANIRDEITSELHQHEADDAFPMKPQRILSDLRKVLADDDILISDVGAHKMWVARQYPTYKSKTCFIYNGFCSMGGALPGAVTAKQLHPEKNIVALCGDGGFIMSIQAIVTAVQLKLPIVVLVWEDDYYGLIKWKQEMEFNEYSHVELANPDLVQLAQGFGCHGVRIESVSHFSLAIKEAFAEKAKPSVLILPVDYSENMKLTRRLGELVSH